MRLVLFRLQHFFNSLYKAPGPAEGLPGVGLIELGPRLVSAFNRFSHIRVSIDVYAASRRPVWT